jgi:phosphoglycolate phosphatase-like HAD superfamily hydrolase
MHTAFQRVYGLAPVEIALQPHGKTDPMLFDEMAQGYGLNPGRLAERVLELQTIYAVELEILLRQPDACRVHRGVPELLEGLAARPDVLLGVVSGNLERTAWLKLEAAGLARWFRAGAFGSDGRHRADLVALAMQRFAAATGRPLAPEHVWVIGDTPDDVAGGRAHGTHTLAVATGRFQRDELVQSGADAVLDDFADGAPVLDILCGGG